MRSTLMLRAAFVTAILAFGCIDDDGSTGPDASTEDDPSSGSGSGAALDGTDPNPPDVALQWIVVGLSLIVVGGSVRSRRRSTKTKTFEI